MTINVDNKFPGVINDRFDVIRLLGQGGMSQVYLAQDKMLPRKVAIKSILQELSTKQEVKKRIEREVKTHASIGSHPNIVTLFDRIEHDQQIFLIMEYIDGITLDQWAAWDYTNNQAISILAEVLSALESIHANNVIHRDIKPENIMIATNELGKVTAKLMDFGISFDEKLNSTSTKLTQIEIGTPGSPAYMSPEQIDEKTFGEVCPASDLYSVGIILYELLTKSPPFTGTMTQILTGHLVSEPDLEQVNIQHPLLKSILSKSLSKNQSDRYTTASEFLFDLNAYAQTGSLTVDQQVDKTQLAVKLDKPEVSTKTQLHVNAPSKSSSSSRLLLSIVLIAALAGGGYVYFEKFEKQATQPPTVVDITSEPKTELSSAQEDEEKLSGAEKEEPIKELPNKATQDIDPQHAAVTPETKLEKLLEGQSPEKQASAEVTDDAIGNSQAKKAMPVINSNDPSSYPSPVASSSLETRTLNPLDFMGAAPTKNYEPSTQATDAFTQMREKRRQQSPPETRKTSASNLSQSQATTTAKQKTVTAKKSGNKNSSSSGSSGWSVTGSSSSKIN